MQVSTHSRDSVQRLTCPDHPSPSPQPVLGLRTDSDATFSQIFSWLSTCRDHALCAAVHHPTPEAYTPTRLLSVGTLKDPHLRLVLTSSGSPLDFRPYVTLSYAWGPPPFPHRLLDSNYISYQSLIDPSTLPLTLSDAVTATRRLGVAYLWIDALCIIQDSPEEWLREGPKIDEVYANAHINLSASNSRNASEGLFRTRRPESVPPARAEVAWGGLVGGARGRACTVVREDFWKREILGQPLYTRGWVLQERLIAARVLHFTRLGVWWQCPGLTASEKEPWGSGWEGGKEEGRWRELLHLIPWKGAREESEQVRDEVEMQKLWRGVVESYTRCDLTMGRDKLMAMAGIARRVQRFFNERYVAGMWERGLVEQLSWKVLEFRSPPQGSEYRAPSWAWPAVNGVIKVPARLRIKRDYTMTIKQGGVHLVWEDPKNDAGRILFGSLTSKAEMFLIRFVVGSVDGPGWTWMREEDAAPGAQCELFPDTPLDHEVSEGAKESISPVPSTNAGEERMMECKAVVILYRRDWSNESAPGSYSGSAIAVEHVSGAQPNVFKRFGLIEFRGFSEEDLRRARRWRKDEQKTMPSKDPADYTYDITIL